MIKVLLAEDDALLSTILVRTLNDAGFDTHGAGDGFATELEIKTWHPDVVLLDLLMPNKDGFAVLRDIRSDSEVFKTNFIILSNLSGPETMEQVKKFGVTDYFIKASMTPGEIVAKLKAMFP